MTDITDKLMEELKNCPFCGECGCLWKRGNYYTVECCGCSCEQSCGFVTKQAAITAWNTRAPIMTEPKPEKQESEQPTAINYKDKDGIEFLAAVGTDAHKWADAFMQLWGDQTKITHGLMVTWFANAIESGIAKQQEPKQPVSGAPAKDISRSVYEIARDEEGKEYLRLFAVNPPVDEDELWRREDIYQQLKAENDRLRGEIREAIDSCKDKVLNFDSEVEGYVPMLSVLAILEQRFLPLLTSQPATPLPEDGLTEEEIVVIAEFGYDNAMYEMEANTCKKMGRLSNRHAIRQAIKALKSANVLRVKS